MTADLVDFQSPTAACAIWPEDGSIAWSLSANVMSTDLGFFDVLLPISLLVSLDSLIEFYCVCSCRPPNKTAALAWVGAW